MALLVFPARNDLPWYTFQISLSNVIFTALMRYNTRMQRWILDLSDPSGTAILVGIPVLIERNLTGQYVTLAVPDGLLFSTDDTGKQNQPTQYDFGISHSMWYDEP